MGDFLICLFTGMFGGHKFFVEKKPMVGFVYLFTFGGFTFAWIYDCVKYYRNIDSRNTSGVRCNLLLKDAETCHFCEQVTNMVLKNRVVGYNGGHSSVSIRVAKRVSVNTGVGKRVPVRANIAEKTPGILTITNQRIVFSGARNSFDNSIDKLTAITPFKDGFELQFGSKSYMFISNKTRKICNLIQNIY